MNFAVPLWEITLENGKTVTEARYRFDLVPNFNPSTNPTGTPGYRNGTESFFGLKGRPSVVRDIEIHNQPVLRMRRK
jgi:hypothetical protein